MHEPTPGAAPIVVAVDEGPAARDALALGRMLAAVSGDPLEALHVYRDGLRRDAAESPARRRALDLLASLTEDLDGDAVTTTAVAGSPRAELFTLAEGRHARAIVVGSSHRGPYGQVRPGSVGNALLVAARTPVALAPRGLAEDPDLGLRIAGVAFDGGPESRTALHAAVWWAQRAHATMRVMGVAPPGGGPLDAAGRTARGAFLDALKAAVAETPRELRALDVALSGDPAPALAEEAEGIVDVLFVGSRGYGPLRRVLLGSVSAQLLQLAPCPVMVLPRGAGEPDAAGGG